MTDHRYQDTSEGSALWKGGLLAFRLGASLVLLVASAGAQETGAPVASDTVTESSIAPDRFHLEIQDEQITLRATDVPLMRLLGEISESTRLTVEVDGTLDRHVSLAFENLPLAEALDRLLEGQNYILQAGSDSERLLVFPSEPSKDRSPTAEESPGSDPRSAGRETEDQRLERLLLALADDDSEVRVEAVSELPELDPKHTIEILTSAALLDPEPAVREECAYALAEIGDETARLALKQLLLDPDARVREAALEAFVDIGGDDSAWAIEFVLYDQDADLRQAAAYALGDIGGRVAQEMLQRALSDEDRFVVEAAMEALEDLAQQEP